MRAVVFLLLLALGAPASAAAESPACRHLAGLVRAQPPGPLFLASYPGAAPGPLDKAAFLYDNAAAAIALVGCGEQAAGQRIGEAILAALDNDRAWHDGRLRNAYAAGVVAPGPVKLPGWWDDAKGMWLEDRYQVGSDNGNMAWAMLALLTLDPAAKESRFQAGALRIGTWVAGFHDPRGPGGFAGGTFGHEPTPAPLAWKSTEHNTDLTAAFARLYARTGDAAWNQRADAARHFVDAMWNEACGCFAAGTGEDGVTPNPTLALDAQIWPLLALPGQGRRLEPVLKTADARLSFGGGYAYGEAKDGVWTEGTAQAALLMTLAGKAEAAQRLKGVIETERAPDGGYFATGNQTLPTGFMLQTDPAKPRLYFHLSHLGATAWAALAESHYNPFTGTKGLPLP